MFVRVLQVIAVTLYIFVAIGTVAYNGLAFYWLVPVLAPAIYFIFTLPDISAHPRPYVPPPPVDRTQINARIEELKSGPPHRNKTQYIDSISRGIPYSNERIDYFELTDLLVLCEHLRPLEAAMRAARLPMDNYRPGLVAVGCMMQLPRIQRHFHLAPCVVFTLGPPPDRHESGVNVIQCTRCGQAIEETLVGGPWPEA
jgi:hypothetical protein